VKSLALTSLEHGIDATLDMLTERIELCDDPDYPYAVAMRTHLRFGHPSRSIIFATEGRTISAVRFAAGRKASIVLDSIDAYTTGQNGVIDVIEIEGGKPIWRHARHVLDGKLRPVHGETLLIKKYDDFSAWIEKTSDGAELLQSTCTSSGQSVNRVFYVAQGSWWWDESMGKCTLVDGHYFATDHARSGFPAAIREPVPSP